MNELDGQLRELVWKWDPIGILNDRSEIPHEYDEVISRVHSIVSRSDSAESCTEEIRRLVCSTLEGFGTAADPATDDQFIRSVTELAAIEYWKSD